VSIDEMEKLANKYDYDLNMHSSDKKWYAFHHDRFPISLEVYPDTEQFSLTSVQGIITMTTGKCSPFSNEVHFLKIQRHLLEILYKMGEIQ
jgi:hypothetical protein